ncbi:MAG: NUDIX domain-containing protein, partial [Alphaproteobacteria bacterium]
ADYASAIMDLGATICTPASPKCPQCPWRDSCIAYQKHLVHQIPLIKKPAKQNRFGTLYLVQNTNGAYYIQKRAGKGLLSGLYEFPWDYGEQPPFQGNWKTENTLITHTFTHFHLSLTVQKITADSYPNDSGIFVQKSELKNYPFPTLMKKVFNLL